MKIAIITISIIAGLFIAFQIYATMATQQTETQTYKVIKSEKDFEIRYYPSTTMAMITSTAKTFKELGNFGFRKLAAYIFGGNKENKQISMTSPVHMDINDSVSSMGFVMPASYQKDSLPTPNDLDITIKTVSDEYVAAITFAGFANSDNIKIHTKMLEIYLKNNNLTSIGNFRFLGYNPPFQILGRRNEIIVAIDWKSK